MKTLQTSTLILAVTFVLACGAARAEGTEFRTPDINDKLNVLVQEKMNSLTGKTSVNDRQEGVVSGSGNEIERTPVVTQESFGAGSAELQPKVL